MLREDLSNKTSCESPESFRFKILSPMFGILLISKNLSSETEGEWRGSEELS